MNKVELKIQKLPHCFKLPEYQTSGAAAMDLYAAIDKSIILNSLDRALIPTGIKIELPKGYEAQVRARSGLAIKNGITLSNCIGTIDEDYRGEVCVGLINLSKESFTINRGDRIAQMLIAPVVKAEIILCEELSQTQRNLGGFGSTGIK